MIDYADLKPGMHVIDIGAGDGRLLIAAKRRCPDITAVGYEIIPTLVWLSRLHAWLRRSSVDLRHGNAFAQDYSKADVIFLYLMPNFLTDLESKFDRELKKGTRVISQAFRFPSRTPMRELMWKDRYRRKRMFLYEW
jgi:precorrin-6B methylase 2